MVTALPRLPARVLFAATAAALAALPLPAQGNGRDADLTGVIGGVMATGPNLGFLRGSQAFQVTLASPQGTLNGMPYFLMGGVLPPGTALLGDLPGEPQVLGVGPSPVPLIGGAAGPSPLLPAGGALVAFNLPPVLPEARYVLQGFVADPAAPNGIAASGLAGGDSGLSPFTDTIFQGVGTLGQLGYGLFLHDLTNDGVADLIATARQADTPAQADAGRAFVYSGLPPVLTFVLDDPAPQALSNFGITATAGDYNGDGYADVCIGARLADVGPVADAGKAVVFWGPAFAATTTLVAPVQNPGAEFGAWADSGDFDGDGYDDLAVSAIRDPNGSLPSVGSVTLFFGPSLAPAYNIPDPFPVAGDRFGYRVIARDFDADGFCDLACSHPFRPLIPPLFNDDAGALSVLYGPFFNAALFIPNPNPTQDGLMGADLDAYDMNGDGWLDLVAGAEFDAFGGLVRQGSVMILEGPTFASISYVLSPTPTADAGFGGAVDAGDFNGDLVPDLFVGEFFFDGGALNSGRVHVLTGPSFTSGFVFNEAVQGSDYQYGRRARTGDLNADGRDDLAVGAPLSSASGVSRAGAVYVISLQ